MLVKSVTYAGEWPTGTYWSPGEVRHVPESAAASLPAGLVLGVDVPAPAPSAKGATPATPATPATSAKAKP